MQNDPPILQCSNFFCQALNLESHQFCHKCRSPMIKRYLWAMGSGLETVASGLVGDRYLLKTDQILLDTKPGLPPESLAEIPTSWEVYLRLSPFRLHVPQIYGTVTVPRSTSTLLLLEDGAIYPDGAKLRSGAELTGSLMPKLTSLWTESDSLRQLNWLWQIAQLWEPFCQENVASTLLNSDLLRVDASFVRLLNLQPDAQESPDLNRLGQFWEQWQQNADAPISDFLTQLCQQMIHGQIKTADQLIDRLDQGITHYGQGQTRTIQIATSTDQGPNRQSNEDACYPASGSYLSVKVGASNAANPLVIVCDGIGGHEGGEVASELAIATLQTQAETLLSKTPDAAALVGGLEQAALAANDLIWQRNDQEHRQERQRMGTTVVMALAHAHELLVNHVGDSRAYRITRTGCYQVTLDDDVASREVRLGYALYRDALQQPGSGSLVQALGISNSNFLHPTVQRFVLDEDCVFLLCSDGLSDHDRIDECWEAEIVPILDGTVDLATASRRLVEIANTRNGHDNVTVGLVYCQVTFGQSAIAPLQIDWDRSPSTSEPSSLSQRSRSTESLKELPSQPSTLKTQIIQPPRSSFRFLPLLVMLLTLLGMGGLLVLLVPEIRAVLSPFSLPPTVSPPIPIPTVSPSPNQQNSALEARMVIQLDRPASNSPQQPVLFSLARQPNIAVPPALDQTIGGIVPGTIARVVNQQSTEDRISWVRLEVCSVPEGSKATDAVKPGDFGWQEERTIVPFVTQNLSLKPAQLGRCAPPTASVSPSPAP